MPSPALSLEIRDRIADVDGATWDVITRDDTIFLSRAYLGALERALPKNVRPRYVVVRRGPVPLAAIAGQLLTVDGGRLLPAQAPVGTGRKRHMAAALALEAISLELFLTGNFLSWGHSGIAFSPHESKAELWPLVADVLDRLGDEDKEIGGAEVELVLDVPTSDTPHANVLLERRFETFQNEPDMVLALEQGWRSYDDYLAALNTKYRKAARDMDKRLAKESCVLERLTDVARHEDALHALYLAVHEKSPFRFVTAGAPFLPALADALDARFSVNVIRRGDELLAFGSTMRDGDTAVAYLVGHDPDENRDLPLYLRLLLASVDDALRMGCRRVAYGRTALEPKARVGARPVPLTVYARHTNRVMHALVAPWLSRLVPKGAPPERNPWKSVGAS